MPTTRPIRAGSPGRAAPIRPLTRAGLLSLAFAALLFSEGCSSLGLGGCGSGCGPTTTAFSGLRNRLASCNLRDKLFHRRPAAIAVDGCDPALGAMPMEPAAEGVIVPNGPSLAAPPADADPKLEPLGAGGSTGGAQGAKTGGVNKSLYQTRANAARGEALEARREAPAARDPLADLPPFDPKDEPPAEASPPNSPAAEDHAVLSPDLKPAEPSASVGPGIRRFSPIWPGVAVGTLGTESTWKWLADLDYKTLIDLRQPSEVQQSEIAAIDHHGLQRISIPMEKDAVKAEVLDKIVAEIAKKDRGRILVFDADGSRAAAVGYYYLVTVAKLEARDAERKLEDMGAVDSPSWKATVAHMAKPATPASADNNTPPKSAPAPSLPSASRSDILSAWQAIAPGAWTATIPSITLPKPMTDLIDQVRANPVATATTAPSDRPASGG